MNASPRTRRSVSGLCAIAALSVSITAAQPATSAHAAAAVCETDHSSTEFGGAAVSQRYGNQFNQSARQHWLDTAYTPQGLGAWPNWKGGSEDLLLVGMHHRDENDNRSLLYGMTPGGTYRGGVWMPKGAHMGGVKVYGKWVYVQHDTSTLRRYRLSTLRESFATKGTQDIGPGAIVNVTDVSSFDIDGGYLYGAKHNSSGRDKMRRWKINKDTGALTRDYGWGPLQVPKNTQGLHVLSNTYVFSTSGGRDQRGNVYVVRRGYTKDQEFTDVKYKCFQSVVMIQEMTGMNGKTYVGNESGATEFSGPDGSGDYRIHNIKHIHTANTDSLRNLVW